MSRCSLWQVRPPSLPAVFRCYLSAPGLDARVALVVGNSAFQYAPRLDDPKNDAADIAEELRKHGFDVIEGDLDRHAFEQKTLAFATAPGSDAGVFFCPGHGMGSPTKTASFRRMQQQRPQPSTSKWYGLTSCQLERFANTDIQLLDVVRDNPLARAISRSMGTRSPEIGRGLATLEAGIDTLIRFQPNPATWRLTVQDATRHLRVRGQADGIIEWWSERHPRLRA